MVTGICSAPVAARAQLLDRYIATDIPGYETAPGVTSVTRVQPAYEPLGIRVGDIVISPVLQESFGYDDNVLATSSGSGSALIDTNAILRGDYTDTVANVSARLSVDDMHFLSESSQDYTNWTGSLGGSYAFGRDTLTVNLEHLTLSQTVSDLDVPQLAQPLQYRVNSGEISYRLTFNRLYVLPDVLVSGYDYDNGTVTGGTPYLQSYRNRTVVQPSVTFGYEISPRRNIVLVIRDADASYSNQSPSFPKRDFNDISVLAGIDYEATAVFRYRLLVGYESRSFQSSQYKTIDGPTAEATVIWTPTELTTLTGTVARHVQDSADETTVGLTETSATLRLDHELLRNVLLRGSGGVYYDDYAQNQGSQTLYTLGVGATWLLNRNLQLLGDYTFTSRESSTTAPALGTFGNVPFAGSYNDNRITVQLRLAL